MTSSAVLTGILVLAAVAFVVRRQLRATPLRDKPLKLPLVLVVAGLLEAGRYLSAHPAVSVGEVAGVLAGLVCAAGIAYPRARSMTVYRDGDTWMRSGSLATLAWWVVSLAAHLACATGIPALFGEPVRGMSGLESSTLLIYLGVTLGVQFSLLHRMSRSADLVKDRTSTLGDHPESTPTCP